MNSLIEWLNVWGGRFVDFALPMLWQSSLVIAAVFVFDFLLRRKIRAAVRYSLWFVVFVKLLLPPTLALPTGAAWWLRGRPVAIAAPQVRSITVNYSEPVNAFVPPFMPRVHVVPPAPTLSRAGWLLVIAMGISGVLGAWLGFRWRYVARCVKGTTGAEANVSAMMEEARRLAGVRRKVVLRVTAEAMSPAVCGLFRPVILLPQSLIEKLTENQLRAVLLHELIHLRRRDVWVNCAQTLLQIVYWWHPLLWVANARVRRVREEAVDDAVMFALREEAEVYAPTLLKVAKLAFGRPLASLGLVGILESRNALRHRIERLLNFTTPRRAGVSMVSVICLAAFTALAVPMGEPPALPAAATDEMGAEKLIPYRAKVNPEVFTRNLKARAEGTMHTTNDDLNTILAAIADGFGVDCTGARAVTFDAAAGEVTAQNTSEQLGVLDEVVRELNLTGGESVLNPPHGLKEVLIEAQFYLIRPSDFQKLGLDSGQVHREDQMSPWWDVSAAEFSEVQQSIRGLGVENLSSPTIQTAHGITASLFIGDGTNNIQLECVPFVHDGLINLTTLARTTGKYAPDGKGWPDFAGHTNCAIFSRMGIPDGAGVVLRADNVGTTTDNELIVLVRAQTTGPKKPVPFLRDLPGVGPFFRNPSNAPAATASNLYTFTFRMDLEALTQRLAKFAAEHNLTGVTNRPTLLVDFLANAGVNTYPSKSFLYREENGQGNLTLRTTQEDLRKAAEALSSALPANGGLPLTSGGVPLTSGDDFYIRNFTTNANSELSQSNVAVAQLVQDGKLLFQVGKIDEAELKLKEALAKDPNDQAALYYLSLIKQIRVRDAVDARNVTLKDRMAQAEKAGADNDARLKSPAPNLYARTNAIYTSPQRQQIYEKLNSIVFDKISFRDMTLSEVVRTLTEQTQRRDPDQQGISFILNRTRPAVNSNSGQPVGFDPTTDQSIVPDTSPDIDLAAVKVKLDPGLTKARLIDVLEAITKTADHPINYAIVDYGIEFFLKGTDVPVLHTRTFKVDPNTFYMGLQNVGVLNSSNFSPRVNATVNTNNGGGQTRGLRYVSGVDSTTEIQLTIIGFLNAIGVNMAAPKSIFFNDRQGTLTVRATDADLELIEQAINTLNTAPPEVTIKVRFVEVDEDFLKNVFPNSTVVGTNTARTGILTVPLFKQILKALQDRDHAALLNEGEVTTLSGRQANFQVVDVMTLVSGVSATVTNNATTYSYRTTDMHFGSTLDVAPYVMADGYTIQLTATPAVTEFLGYEDPKAYVKYDANLKKVKLPLPKYRSRQTSTTAIVWDGQTLVLGNLTDETVVSEPDGTKLRQPFNDKRKKQLLIFITPTIVDPSGNRVHKDETKDYYDDPRPR